MSYSAPIRLFKPDNDRIVFTDKAHPGAYKENRSGKFLWIQKLCFRILERLDCAYIEKMPHPEITCKEFVIDPQDVIKSTHELVMAIYRQSGSRPEVILVGHKQFLELTRAEQEYANQYFTGKMSFKMPPGSGIHYLAPTPGIEMGAPRQAVLSLAGMEVIVVPWMDGYLPLPDLKQLRGR